MERPGRHTDLTPMGDRPWCTRPAGRTTPSTPPVRRRTRRIGTTVDQHSKAVRGAGAACNHGGGVGLLGFGGICQPELTTDNEWLCGPRCGISAIKPCVV